MTQFVIAAGIALFFGAAVQKGFGIHPMKLIGSVAVIVVAYAFAVNGRPAVEGGFKDFIGFLQGREVLVAGVVAGLFLGSLIARLTQSD